MKKNKGFTLIELLITIVILGLLASIVAPEMFSKVGSTKRKTAAAQMKMFETAINTYRLDVGDLPESLEALRVKGDKKGWDGPYLPKNIPLDPWGNPYDYKVPGENGEPFYLASFGKDGQNGGEEDNADIIHQ
ncbi:type II secretion system major pseudopilin GspG [Litorilituus lipolyticus]|uniref:Type II secretion system core protein G n=1 Tax=Litorilituus lipolyticus TaxID=2491017 RepID=A0A502L5G7_9GAMM|nr:type II secretion system major pseudopilin GspG [Litorilituus lipolyticus]TPH18976.1 type II secretion system protein GspG [Litorilituus lipolyticus]